MIQIVAADVGPKINLTPTLTGTFGPRVSSSSAPRIHRAILGNLSDIFKIFFLDFNSLTFVAHGTASGVESFESSTSWKSSSLYVADSAIGCIGPQSKAMSLFFNKYRT